MLCPERLNVSVLRPRWGIWGVRTNRRANESQLVKPELSEKAEHIFSFKSFIFSVSSLLKFNC